MGEKKSVEFIKWFSQIFHDSIAEVGGKGANLGEMYNNHFPVPPGFVITTQAYQYFIQEAELKEKIQEILDSTDIENTKELEDNTAKIRELIIKSKMPEELETEIKKAYVELDETKDAMAKAEGIAYEMLKRSRERSFVAIRSSATTEDLVEASFAGQQESFINIKGESQLLLAVKKCLASLFTARAVYYRRKKGFADDKALLAVVVQKMVDSRQSGVMFSRAPVGDQETIIVEAIWGQGEGIVSGRIKPDQYVLSRKLEIIEKKLADKKIAIIRDSAGNTQEVGLKPEFSNAQVLSDEQIKKCAEFALKLEKHYKLPQDIEFAVEDDNIYIVQTRPVTTLKGQKVRTKEQNIDAEPILMGLAASQGIVFGKVAIIEEMKDLQNISEGDILVTKMTNPDMVVAMQKCAAVVTDEGGMTAHAAIISREMGIPAVVGTEHATKILKTGQIITVDGFDGKVYDGQVIQTNIKKEVIQAIKTNFNIKVNVDLPSAAERASKTGITKVGLCRLEGIIAESGKHPLYFVKKKEIEKYEEIIYQGVKQIAKYFKQIWVRTSDIRSDEYNNLEGAPKEKEANPMLGMHGIRFGLKNPEILQAEINALQRVASEGTIIGIMMPQIISIEEVQEVKKILGSNEHELQLGVMIETPAAVQIIKSLCREGIQFISFGTNDLTQYTLAIDRGNKQVQYLYNELHPAVLAQIKKVILTCKDFDVETSICGQAANNPEMVKYLYALGINGVSVNADAANEISQVIQQLEQGGKVQKQVEEDVEVTPLTTTEPETQTTTVTEETQAAQEYVPMIRASLQQAEDNTRALESLFGNVETTKQIEQLEPVSENKDPNLFRMFD